MLGVKPPSVILGHGTVLLQFRVFLVLKVRKTVPLRTSRGIVNCVIWPKVSSGPLGSGHKPQ